MLGYLFIILLLFSLISAAFCDRLPELSAALMNGAGEAVNLAITLLGIMMLWNGLMQVAKDSGLMAKFTNLLSPVINLLFPELKNQPAVKGYIAMNMTANFFGLGNAATPIGLKAMQQLQASSCGRATRSMSMLVLINTASIQFIPSTIAAMRSSYGSENPFDILPLVWINSIAALLLGVAVFNLIDHISRKKERVKCTKSHPASYRC